LTTKCPDGATLQKFADGLLSAEKESAIEAHVDQCSSCQQVLQQFDLHVLSLPRPSQDAEQDSTVLAARLTELKAASSTGGSSFAENVILDLQPWLDKTTDEDGRRMVDEFELRECIGRGGMGIVFRALDTKLKRLVALKFMSPNLLTSENAQQRFFREAQAAAAIAHVNVVAVHSVNQFNELPYLVMELVPGETLAKRIERARLPIEQVIAIGKQISYGLAAAHAVGVQHRDIKPTNIMMDGNIAKLSDFGLARVAASEVRTGTGTLVGTPEFIAPERIEPKLGPSDHRSDLFSLGAVLYTMATGKAPFTGDSVLETLKSICVDEPKPIADQIAGVPDWLVVLISRLLAKRPEERIQDSSDVVRILEQQAIAIDVGDAIRDPHPEVETPKAWAAIRLWAIPIVVGCVLAIGGWASFSWFGGDSRRTENRSSERERPLEKAGYESQDNEAYIRVESDRELAELLSENSEGDIAIALAADEFHLPTVEIERRDVTLVAAEGFHPTLFLSMNRNGNGLTAVHVELSLRGVTIESDFDAEDGLELDESEALLVVDGGSLVLEDCSIEHHASTPCVMLSDANAEVRSCNVLAPSATAFIWQADEEHELEMNDSVILSETQFDLIEPFGKMVRLWENTFVGHNCFECGNDEAEASLFLTTQDNTFVCSNAMFCLYQEDSDSDAESVDWIHWKSVSDVLPVPLLKQVNESEDGAERRRAWALIESLAEFENVSFDGSDQESEFQGLTTSEILARVSDGELTPEIVRNASE